MKNIFILLFFFSTTMYGQLISTTVTKDLDTLLLNKVGQTKVIKVGYIAYKDSIIRGDTIISSLKKYASAPVPPTPGTTFNLSFTQIPITDPDLNAPGRGVEQWHNANEVNVPIEGTNTPRLDLYRRFVWTKLEGRTQGSYNWAYFDGLVQDAINAGQKFSFGIMTVFAGNDQEAGGQQFSDGSWGCYPEYVHTKMQSESVKDWKASGSWIPNYNSVFYTDRLLALHKALNAHIYEKGWEKVINIIDIRGYGNYGEWHSTYVNHVSEYPAGTFPTNEAFKRIVDAHTLGFPNFQLVAMIAAFDAQFLGVIWNPPYIAEYILNVARNNRGVIGWRRDQWGATDGYLAALLENNNRNYNGGTAFSSSIMNRWKTAPITGEPPAWNERDYFDLERQIRLYHASSFGNGNYGSALNATIKANVRAASKASGYRLILTGGSVTPGSGSLKVSLNWQNIGIAPTYEDWNVVFELVNSAGTVAWTTTSTFKPRLFLPQSVASTITETFPLIVPAGTYTLRMAIKDPTGYRGYLPLAIQGKNSDNSINLKTGLTF